MDRIRVSRNTDNTLLARTFPEAMQAIAAASSTGSLFGNESYYGEPPPEPEDYIPNPGKSTYRGSRTVSQPSGRPWNSPADVVRQEVFKHTDYYKDGDVHPSIQHQKFTIQDNIQDPHLPPPPSQINSIPPEFRNQVTESDIVKTLHHNQGGNGEMNINDIVNNRSHVSARPAPVITSSVPPAPNYNKHYQPAPPPVEKRPQFIPPTKPEPPFQPTEDMILKINGYNERNMRLLGDVSKNITKCTEMIAKLNDLTKPINVNEMMGLLEFMDNEAYRALFIQAFENLLNKNLELHSILTMYLSGKGPEEAEPEPETLGPQSIQFYPDGNVTVTGSGEDTTIINDNTGEYTVQSGENGDTQNDSQFQENTNQDP
jgi:hypothetical protein